MALASMSDLMLAELRDLYSAEHQLVMALPTIATGVATPRLRKAFTHALDEAHDHVVRLAHIFKLLGEKPRGPKCEGMAALISDAVLMIVSDGHDSVRDAGIVAAAQRFVHFEIAAYGSSIALATLLAHTPVSDLLGESLKEVRRSSELLAEIAEEDIHTTAPAFDEDSDDEEGGAWWRPRRRSAGLSASSW